MNTKMLDIPSIRVLSEEMTSDQINECLQFFTERKVRLDKVKDHKTHFLKMVEEWGYKTPTDFLTEVGITPKPKKERKKISDEDRQKIISDLTEGKLSNKEVSKKYGITMDSVYNIRAKNGLTSPKKKTEETPTPIVPPSDTPSEQTPMAA